MEYIDPNHLALLGLLVIVVMLLRLSLRRIRRNAEKKRQFEEALRLTKAAERKQQMQVAIPKSKVSGPKTRLPMADPLGTPFTGNIQGVAAKWESEIHKLGRQIIGQIDSKMAALQAITLDANRTANRLEILVEHLEQIARQQIEWQKSQIAQSQRTLDGEAAPRETEPVTVVPSATGTDAENSVPEAAPLGDMLKELSEDLEGVHRAIKQSTTFSEEVEPAVVLRLAELQAQPPEPQSLTTRLSSNLRGEVEMFSNYGIEPEEIARRLNISLAEVDLIQQIQQSRVT